MKPVSTLLCNSKSIQQCVHIQRVTECMKRYNANYFQKHHHIGNISCILDDYLHIIAHHSTDEHFEFIFSQLPFCNIISCKIFRRHYTNRNETDTNHPDHVQLQAQQDIADKIHCFLHHSFDIGHRLSIKNKQSIDDIATKTCYEIKEDTIDEYLFRPHLTKLNEILLSKQKLCQNISDRLSARATMRYNYEVQIDINEPNQCTDHKDEEENDSDDENMYSFGYQFCYGYAGEYEKKYANLEYSDIISVSPKYNDLKTELISNRISTLSMAQYTNQYKQAVIHFNSAYCKQYIKPFMLKLVNSETKHCIQIPANIQMHHIICLMVYCNFTELQYKFSKTYRTNKGRDHDEFYHLGMFLKMAVKKFGTRNEDRTINIFYHGINEKLMFPEYIGRRINGQSIPIFSPLSTSSSRDVAVNFANCARGIIVEFEYMTDDPEMKYSIGEFPRYFDVAWLSDYAHESECLFIQQEHWTGLKINNFIDPSTAREYKIMLNAMKTIENIVGETKNFTTKRYAKIFGRHGTKKQSLIKEFGDILGEHTYDERLIPYMFAMLSHQLSSQLSEYKQYFQNDAYAQYICNTFFENTHIVSLDYQFCNEKHSWINPVIFYPNYEWVNVKLCHILFPNVMRMYIHNVDFCWFMINDLIEWILYLLDIYGDPGYLEITAKKDSTLSTKQTVDIIAPLLRGTYVICYAELSRNTLHIVSQIEHISIAAWFIANFERNYYFQDEENRIVDAMKGMIHSNLQNALLYSECMKREQSIVICWDEISLYRDSYLFEMFCCSSYEWVNLELIDFLFPKLRGISVNDIKFCGFIMDDILVYLSTKIRRLQRIFIRPKHDPSLNISQIITIYKDKFDAANLVLGEEYDGIQISIRTMNIHK